MSVVWEAWYVRSGKRQPVFVYIIIIIIIIIIIPFKPFYLALSGEFVCLPTPWSFL